MSRSYKKHPFASYVSYKSNKKDKQRANKLFRIKSKQNIKTEQEPLYSLNEVSNTYLFSSDGLASYVGNNSLWKKQLRK